MKKLIVIAIIFLISGCSQQKKGCSPYPKQKREIKFKGFLNIDSGLI